MSKFLDGFRCMVCFAVFCLLFAAGLGEPCFPQTLHATVRGQLLDRSGARLANVLVQAINEETQETRRTVSGADGEYTLAMLPPGKYRFEAEITGFRKYVSTGIQLLVGQNVRMDLTLEPGGPDQEIIVTASQMLVEPDGVRLGSVIENRQIVNFPLDGRNFLQLGLLLPGFGIAGHRRADG